jgi:segregation and condensation protein B
MERGLVRIAGRDDSLGRPQLYGTTKKFLQTFGFKTIRDLPPAEGVGTAAKQLAREAEEEEVN